METGGESQYLLEQVLGLGKLARAGIRAWMGNGLINSRSDRQTASAAAESRDRIHQIHLRF
jgi:hypothetical protein